MSAPPATLVDLQAEIDEALDAALGALLSRFEDHDSALAPVADAVRSFVAGGKRVRPALLLLGFEATGGAPREAAHGPALALELLHTFALVHDDVIDRAVSRRGRPTVHQSFARRHESAGWNGDAAAYGDAVAILVGDLAFVHADELFLHADVPAERLLEAFRRFTTLREELMVGQYLDLQTATSRTTDRELALRVATLKSGRYSVARPLELGAVLAGADPALRAGLVRFGDPLGRAFQVRDDLLGVFGEEVVTGKSVSSDLAEGKRTLLIAEAAARLGPAGLERLEAGLGDPSLDADRVAELRDLLEQSGARDATEAYVAAAITEAEEVLAGLDGLAPEAAAALADLASYLGERST